MLTKLHQNGSFRQILRGLNQKRLSSYASDHHRTKVQILTENKATVDHLPQPKGKWEDLNSQREKQNNIILAAGAGLFLLSLVVTKDLWSDMRWNPPYEKISKDFPGAKFTS